MTRDIIEIDEALCDGCGDCVVGCSEGAIKIIDGKAKLVREDFCDGFGDCMAVCHSGALKVIKREAAAFDDAATREHLLRTQGPEAVRKYEESQRRHEASQPGPGIHIPVMQSHAQHGASGGGCPGSAARELRRPGDTDAATASAATASAATASAATASAATASAATEGAASENPATPIPSELGQWPVQLHLVQPGAPFFRDREMLVMSTCGPIASAEVHQRYIRNRSVVVACPKLDNTAPYAQKLGSIFQEASIPKVIVVIMEVPCCRGLSMIVQQALALSGRSDLVVEEHTLSLDGVIKNQRQIT